MGFDSLFLHQSFCQIKDSASQTRNHFVPTNLLKRNIPPGILSSLNMNIAKYCHLNVVNYSFATNTMRTRAYYGPSLQRSKQRLEYRSTTSFARRNLWPPGGKQSQATRLKRKQEGRVRTTAKQGGAQHKCDEPSGEGHRWKTSGQLKRKRKTTFPQTGNSAKRSR